MAAAPAKPLSKLKQRVQSGAAARLGGVSPGGSRPASPAPPPAEPEPEAIVLPETALFAAPTESLAARPSAFAGVVLPALPSTLPARVVPDLTFVTPPSFVTPSPDDVVLRARQGTSLGGAVRRTAARPP